MKIKFLNKISISFLLIVLIGIIFRLLCLDKVGGLSYDEIIGSYNEAHQPNILSVIFYTLKIDIHFPLYQILLHLWGNIFSFSDYSLRAFSAVCGVMTVIFSFFIGKELKSKQTGLICASIFALNSFLIYYAQEVRMYSLIALFSSIYLLFLVKIKNNHENKWNYLGFCISAFAVILSYPISTVFIFAQTIALIIYLLYEHKENRKFILKQTLITIILLIIFCSPFFGYLYLHQAKYLNFFGSSYCDWTSVFVLLQDWFTPVLELGTPTNYIEIMFSNFNIYTIISIVIPILLAMYSIICSIKKDKFSIVIFSGTLFFLISEIIAVIFTNFRILPRYTMVIVPNLLILVGYGFSLIDNKKHLKSIFLSAFLIVNMYYLVFMAESAFRMPRAGFKTLARALTSNKIKKDDFVVVWNNTSVLNKYIDKRLNVLSLLKNFAYTSEVILVNETVLNKLPLDERKKALRQYFASDMMPQNTIYLVNAIYNDMKSGQKFIITTDNFFDSFTQKTFTQLVNNNNNYDKVSFNYLLTIKALIDLKELSYARFHFVKKLQNGSFVVIIFEK